MKIIIKIFIIYIDKSIKVGYHKHRNKDIRNYFHYQLSVEKIYAEAKKMTLNDVKPGTTVKIENLEHSNIKTRLMSMGLIKGTPVKVLRSAPLGDPMAISVRSYNLSLRLDYAKKITVSAI